LLLATLPGDIDEFPQSGDDTIALFDWMDQLHGQALSTRGTVLLHLGNHEWMNAMGVSTPSSLCRGSLIHSHCCAGDWR
jgi:hypothetical protein